MALGVQPVLRPLRAARRRRGGAAIAQLDRERGAPSPLEARLRALSRRGQAGLVPFVTAGHLGPRATAALLGELERAGAAAIEVGIPFSDPLADGPAIQHSSEVALAQGATLGGALESIALFHRASTLPVVVMSYVNPVLAHGAERFAREAAAAGVSGVILTDLPPEERPDVWATLAACGLDAILLVAPTTAPARRTELARRARGFVYCVSRLGVTGGAAGFGGELGETIAEIRRVTDLPVGVGFGVSNAERARAVARLADAVIVGTAVCERLEEARPRGSEAAIAAAGELVRTLARAVAEVEKPARPESGAASAAPGVGDGSL